LGDGAIVKVSVIVPAFNEEQGLAQALGSIQAASASFAARGWSCQLIVVDNNSTDRTASIAADAGAEVVFEPINQISRARNAGAARATGEWLLFVDADSHPTPELFADVARAIEGGVALAGGSTVRFDVRAPRAALGAHTWNATSRIMRWAAGSFIFCDAAVFRAAGGFSTEFFAGEEIDLFRRLKRYARQHRRRVVILHRHPLLTSGRKLHLYSRRELASFVWRTIFSGGRTLRRPADCFAWYDGRR
jgi:glycosyltransferase involved in cell wall biosynthesis